MEQRLVTSLLQLKFIDTKYSLYDVDSLHDNGVVAKQTNNEYD